MTTHPPFARAAALALLGVLATVGSHADSLASSASSAGSASVGSASDSLTGSSKSSNRAVAAADGDYQVTRVAAADTRPGALKLTLRGGPVGAAAEGAEIVLTLPQAALGERGIAVGEVVQVRNRNYGVAFARAAAAGTDGATAGAARAPEPFFLVLKDEWHREIDPRAVTL